MTALCNRAQLVLLLIGMLGGLTACQTASSELPDPAPSPSPLAAPAFFDWLPSGIPAAPDATLQMTREFALSNAHWDPTLDERQVFHARLTGPGGHWTIGVGRGGQMDSLQGGFGETIPPQLHRGSEWNDEVWQVVAVDNKRQGDYKATGFPCYIHGSGTYRRDKEHDATFYGPIIAEHFDPAHATYEVVTWPQQAHVPTPFESDLFYVTRWWAIDPYTVEVTYGIHNWGRHTYSFMNVPWGGVRATLFPQRHIAMADGSLQPQAGRFPTPREGLPLSQSGGWLLFAVGDQPTDNALALVIGSEDQPWPGAQPSLGSIRVTRQEMKHAKLFGGRSYATPLCCAIIPPTRHGLG